MDRVIKGHGIFMSPDAVEVSLDSSRNLYFEGWIEDVNTKSELEYFLRKQFRFMGGASLPRELYTDNGLLCRAGDWAIIIRISENELVAFTDPLGVKQLYYDEVGNLSTDIKSLCRGREFCPLYKSQIAKFGYNTNDLTPWKGVKRIVPNRLYRFQLNVNTVKVFEENNSFVYDFEPSITTDYVGAIRYTVEDSVRILLRRVINSSNRDKTVNILLSGGLDSSIVALLCSQIKEETEFKDSSINFRYITIENRVEDYVKAKLMAAKLGVTLSSIRIPEKLYKDYDWLNHAMEINESPIDLGSMIPNQFMFGNVPNSFVITGDGADELFGGYQRVNIYDSQLSDIFDELSYYHLPRLEKASSYYGISLLCPFLSRDLVKVALNIPYELRKNKECLKKAFPEILEEILNRPKMALKNDLIVRDKEEYKHFLISLFYGKN